MTAKGKLRDKRDNRIRAIYKRGKLTHKEIAKLYDLTTQRVQQICVC